MANREQTHPGNGMHILPAQKSPCVSHNASSLLFRLGARQFVGPAKVGSPSQRSGAVTLCHLPSGLRAYSHSHVLASSLRRWHTSSLRPKKLSTRSSSPSRARLTSMYRCEIAFPLSFLS